MFLVNNSEYYRFLFVVFDSKNRHHQQPKIIGFRIGKTAAISSFTFSHFPHLLLDFSFILALAKLSQEIFENTEPNRNV